MLRKPHMNKHYATVVLMGKWNKKTKRVWNKFGKKKREREEGRSSGLIHL